MQTVVSSPPPVPVAKPPTPSSSLPEALTGPSSILWTWVVPIFVLCILNGLGYRLISDSLDAKNREIAYLLGALNLANLAAGVGVYVVALRRASKGLPSLGATELAGVPAMAMQAVFLLLSLRLASDLLPWSVRTWLYPEPRFIFNQASLAMLPFVAGLVQFAGAPPLRSDRAILTGLGCAAGVPVALYVAMHIVGKIGDLAALPIFMVISGFVLAALLGVVMFVRLFLRTPWLSAEAPGIQCMQVGIFAVGLPAIGLAMNAGTQFPADFQSWEVPTLTAVNAIVLFYAVLWPARWPRVTLALVAVTLPFSLYFFLAFLPYVPIG
ncbi:MAG TPA: hypothetical protein VGE76_24055, partial [Opitutaceae bacterium]